MFQQEGDWLSQVGKTFWIEILYEKNYSISRMVKQRWSSQQVNLPGALSVVKSLLMLNNVLAWWTVDQVASELEPWLVLWFWARPFTLTVPLTLRLATSQPHFSNASDVSDKVTRASPSDVSNKVARVGETKNYWKRLFSHTSGSHVKPTTATEITLRKSIPTLEMFQMGTNKLNAGQEAVLWWSMTIASHPGGSRKEYSLSLHAMEIGDKLWPVW